MTEKGLQVLSLIAALTVWQLAGWYVGTHILPGPIEVFPVAWDLIESGDFWEHLRVSLRRVFVGFGVAFVIGMGYGIAAARIPLFRSLATPLATVVMSTTSLVIVFVAMLAMGQTETTMTIIVTLIVFGFIGTPIRDALNGIDEELLIMAQSFKCSTLRRLRDVYIPYLVPAMLATSRIGFNIAWKIVALAEVFGFGSGIGRQISLAYFTFDMTRLFAWLLIFLIVIILIEQLLREYERRTSRWRIGAKTST